MPGNPNLYAEGFHGIDYVNNMGFIWGNPEFPDSLAANHLGGNHTIVFSGKDFWEIQIHAPLLSYAWSGIIGPRSQIVDQTGSFYLETGKGTSSDPSFFPYPHNVYYSGATRFHWDTRHPDEGGTNKGGAKQSGTNLYNNRTPKLRTAYDIQNSVPYGTWYNIVTTGMNDISVYTIQNCSILDIISEGPIEGFVTGSYIYNISGKNVGDIGYNSVTFSPFVTGNIGYSAQLDPTRIIPPEARSIFWNETPVATTEGLLNFRFISFKYDYGTPNSHTISNPYINLYEDRYHYDGYSVDQNKYPVKTSVTKSLNETLYGPVFYSGTVSGLTPAKKYYIYNTEAESIKIGVKINALYSQITSGVNAGVVLPDEIKFGLRLWRVFADRKEVVAVPNITVPTSNPRLFTSDDFRVRGKIQKGSLIHYTFHIRPQAENGYFIDLMPNQIGWAVEINKLTEEFNQSARSNSTTIDSINFVYANRFVYPNTAMVFNNFNAKYFAEIPDRKYKMRLLKVKVPSNYDPIAKKYNNFWDGTFKLAWTDNPAWCLYDLITNNRFGLGKYIDSKLVDKWSLYEISQYCDQLVPDGMGGLEPRFTCNVLISTKDEAHKILNDMASIFNGLIYYSAGQLFINQDRPKDTIYLFNNSNVVDGTFTYSSSAKKARRSVALVRYNDENNNYLPAVEYVEDRSALLKYGIRQTEIVAFGATKTSQAKRMGRWYLTTENLETETVTFDVGLDGAYLRPGDIIKIYDENQKYQNFGGRTLELKTGEATIDVEYNQNNLYALTGTVNPLKIHFLTPTFNIDYGTYLGNLYITGYNQTSSGISGLNSNFFRKSQIQTMEINNLKNYIGSGSGIYQNYIRISFPSGLDQHNQFKSLPNNTVWTIDYNPALYSGFISNRYGINNPSNLLYPGYYLEGYLNVPETYRVTNINQKSDVENYTITALKYVDQKYTDIVTGEALISVPTKIPQPQDPSLSLRILYRDVSGNYGGSSHREQPPAYTSNQTGINSIAYTINPPTNSGDVSYYNIYRRFNNPFVNGQILDSDLFDALPSPLRNQTLGLPRSSATGNLPPFFTPTGTGTWYIGVQALNPYNEKSNFITSSITLSAQALPSLVLTGGINVVGGMS
jgi:hypothetical protein